MTDKEMENLTTEQVEGILTAISPKIEKKRCV